MTVWNFGAGPAMLPREVLEQARDELLNFNHATGMSLIEMSHRSKVFEELLSDAQKTLLNVLDLSESKFHALFFQGGATLQFSALPLNLLTYSSDASAAYLVTGAWSKKAYEEADRLFPERVDLVCDGVKESNASQRPQTYRWPSRKPLFIHYCDNETIHGMEWPEIPTDPSLTQCPFEVTDQVITNFDAPERPFLVADMSSNICSRRLDSLPSHAVIYAGAQKNIGPSGVTVLILRNDVVEYIQYHRSLLKSMPPNLPLYCDWITMVKNSSMYNTPNTFGIYMCSLVFKWLEKRTLEQVQKTNNAKASLLYSFLDSSMFYKACVSDADFRSKMNVTFRIVTSEGCADEAMEKKFVSEAEEKGYVQLKGHRSVGGLRASLYNAMSLGGVQNLVEFMTDFQKRHGRN